MEKSINPLQLDKPPHLKKKQITIIRDLMARYQEPYDLSKKKIKIKFPLSFILI